MKSLKRWTGVIAVLYVWLGCADTLQLGSDAGRLSLTADGRVLELFDGQTGTVVAVTPEKSPAWVLRTGKGAIQPADYPQPPTVEVGENQVTFHWEATGLPEVTGVIGFDPVEKQFHFRATVRNTGLETLESLAFPAELSLPADDPDNYLIVASDTDFITRTRPLDTLQDFSVMYPGFMFMQLSGFKVGDSALLAYTDDPAGNIKWHSYRKRPGFVDFVLSQFIFLAPGKSWEAPFGVVLTTIPHGTYNEMAAQYARWGGAQSWAASKLAEKSARNPLLAKIFTNGLIRVGWPPIAWGTACFQQDESGRYHYIENTEYARYEPYYDELLKYFADYERFYGIAPGYWLAVWNGDYFDTAYPNYFPVKPYMGDFDAFQRTASLRGLPLLYHMNIVHWPVFAPQAAQREYHASWQGGTYAYQKWSNVDHQLVNLGKSIEVELPTVRKLRDENGSGGVYLDVVGHAFVQDNSPANPFREAPNPYQLAKVKAFEQIRAILTGPVMTEGRSEIYLPSIDLAYGACGSTAIEDQIPLWEMVYGDCVATHPFNSMDGHRNMTMSMGGVFGLPWKWPGEDGTNVNIFTESTQQRLMAQIIGERMLRFDRPGGFRVSQWPSGCFLWNRDREPGGAIGTADLNFETVLGVVEIRQMESDGAFLLTAAGDFSAEKTREVSVNGELWYRCNVPGILFVRAGERWLIRNMTDTALQVELYVASPCDGTSSVDGRLVSGGKIVTVERQPEGEGCRWSVTLPAQDALVNWFIQEREANE